MKPRWIITAAAALALALLTVPMLRRGGSEHLASSTGTAPAAARAEVCDASGAGKLDFVLKDKNNVPLDLATFKGKVVLLNFWATWCGPCKEEIPSFVEMYDKYKGEGLEIVGVSIDDTAEQLQQFTHEWHMRYPVVQMQSDIEDAYGPFYGVPTSYFIARDGTVCTKHLGPIARSDLEPEIQALLKMKPAV
jgi:cytochrome c biogenesis protein CcmG/thiol:disulfide interchange protein DsbE